MMRTYYVGFEPWAWQVKGEPQVFWWTETNFYNKRGYLISGTPDDSGIAVPRWWANT